MDFDDIKELLTVAIVLVPIIFGYLSELIKKNKQHSRNHAVVQHDTRTVSPVHMPLSETSAEIPPQFTGKENDTFVEGERVTADVAQQPAQLEDITPKELKQDELRRAVIWSEILTPKFNR